jgi:DNA-binding NarL/FixJ family response regulator
MDYCFGVDFSLIFKISKTTQMNVVIADDHKLVCQSLEKGFRSFAFIKNIHATYNGKDAISIIENNKIDLALLDVRMPIMNGLSAATHILRNHTNVKVICMTMFREEPTILDLVRVGVHGILLKENSDLTDVENAIARVMSGKMYLSEGIQNIVSENIHKLREPSRLHFTPREIDVLKLTCMGKVAKEISVELGISCGSVQNYRKEMLHKT